MTQSSKTDTAQDDQELIRIRALAEGRIARGLLPGQCESYGGYTITNHGNGQAMVSRHEAGRIDMWELRDLPDPFLSRHPALVPVSPEVAELTGHYAALADLAEGLFTSYDCAAKAAALTWALGKLEDAIQDAEDKARRRADQPRCADCGSPGAHLVDCTSVHPALAREGLFSLSNAVDAPDEGPHTYAPDCTECGATDIEHEDTDCWNCGFCPGAVEFDDDPVTGITDASSARAEKASWRPAGAGQGQTLADMQAEMDNIMSQVADNIGKMDDLGRKAFPAPSGYDALLSALKTEAAGIDLEGK